MASLGSILLIAALLFNVYAMLAIIVGLGTKNMRLWWSGQGAAVATATLTSAAVFTLWYLLITSNFHVADVYQETSRELPLFYKITALWAGNSGSLLFWSWILSLYTAYVALHPGRKLEILVPYATLILNGILLFFLLLINFVVSPFQVLPAQPYDGLGLNPLLQNVWMVIHPPMLYTGYIGMSVPFAFGVASLLAKQNNDRWLVLTRRWALVAWSFLTAGLMLGGYWAYVELGWGGYWAWDPVENAALMPWLSTTAFLHLSIVQTKRGMFRFWNMSLLILSFLLTIFGTYLTRSGIVVSVHAFTGTGLGPYYLTFLAILVIFSLGTLYFRRGLLQESRRLEMLVSKEASFMLNNLLFLVAIIAVFWGTIFPVTSNYLLGNSLSLGVRYYDSIIGPLSILTIFLMGIGPLLSWGKAPISHFGQKIRLPLITGLVSTVLFTVLAQYIFHKSPLLASLSIGATIFSIGTLAGEFKRGIQARGEQPLKAVITLFRRSPHQYGGYIIHLGVALAVIGVTGSWVFHRQNSFTMRPGQSVSFYGKTLTYGHLYQKQVGSDTLLYPTIHIGSLRLKPTEVSVPGASQPSSIPAISHSIGGDLYLVLAALDGGHTISLEVTANPLINFYWLGGIIAVLGAILALANPKEVMDVKERTKTTSKLAIKEVKIH